MANHPIESLMKTAMESIQGMVDVNTIVGDPVETHDGSVIIPITRVACGFAAGGSEFAPPEGKKANSSDDQPNNENSEGQKNGKDCGFPFGGGSGAGVSVQPVGFLVVGNGQVRLLPIEGNVILDRLIDTSPNLIDRILAAFKKNKEQPEDKGAKGAKEKTIVTEI